MNDDYYMGYDEGFEAGYRKAMAEKGRGTRNPKPRFMVEEDSFIIKKPKRKVKQSPKQKLLTKMTKKKWDKYKKGKGKKTYVQIRAEVSRSLEFKKKARRL